MGPLTLTSTLTLVSDTTCVTLTIYLYTVFTQYLFPALVYAWKKSDSADFWSEKIDVRPELNHQVFVSGNGKLYFSEVTGADNGYYFCIVTMTLQNINQNVISTHGTPSKTSNPVQLRVTSSGRFIY